MPGGSLSRSRRSRDSNDRKKLAVRTCALLRRENNNRDRDCMLKGNYAGIEDKRELI